MEEDLNVKHVVWHCRVTTRKSRLLLGNKCENSCLIRGPETPTTILYNPSVTPDVLHALLTKNLVTP
jgi:hypothetical protein